MITLNDRIKYIKKALKSPNHMWVEVKDIENPRLTMVKLRLESNKGTNVYPFTGKNMTAAVETAEAYVANEIKMGTISDPNTPKETK